MKWDLDRIDIQIIDLLQNNIRLSNKELAAAIGLAPSTCLARVQRLRDDGILGGAHARVAPEAMGIGLQAMLALRLGKHSRQHVKAFWKHALSVKEVLSIFHVTGDKDFLVHVAVRDTQHLRDIAMDAFASRPEVAHIETSLIFEHVIKPALPNLRPSEAKAPSRK